MKNNTESTPLAFSDHFVLSHLTNESSIGKIDCHVNGKSSLVVALEQSHDEQITLGLDKINTLMKALEYSTPVYLKEKNHQRTTITLTYPEAVTVMVYLLNTQPDIIQTLAPDANINQSTLKKKTGQWLKVLMKQHQSMLETHCRKHHSDLLFQAISEYGQNLSNKTYQVFLRQLLKKTHETILDLTNQNKHQFIKTFLAQQKKFRHSLLVPSAGVRYLADNFEKKPQLGLKGVINGYYEFYGNRLTRRLPTALNKHINAHLKIQAEIDALYNKLRDVDAELHTEMRDEEKAHHLRILITQAKHLQHQAEQISVPNAVS